MTLIEEYINNADVNHQDKLNQIYLLIKGLVPMAEETLSWGMPTLKVKGNLVHFAEQKKHLGFYPGSSCVELFETDLNEYKHSKGAIQFPYDKELPVELIKKIVLYRLKENLGELEG
jgi:uncharacterized protein YdhG (YjbR/CyaY superfamily)